MYKETIEFVKGLYPKKSFIPLHEPVFDKSEEDWVVKTIRSTFVSSVGKEVKTFESMICELTGAEYSIATSTGTSALHIILLLAGVKSQDEVITQSFSFVATANAVAYCGATPHFVDIEKSRLGIDPKKLRNHLLLKTELKDGFCVNKETGKVIRACIPMHSFGMPSRIDEIKQVCDEFNIVLLEDAAEALGSKENGRHIGNAGQMAAFSFNGNKIVTTGGGGVIITSNKELAEKARHLTTTAKVGHPNKFYHDELGFNYRMPNLNAALGCAQLLKLEKYLTIKRKLGLMYQDHFSKLGYAMLVDSSDTESNYWLNAVFLKNSDEKEEFLNIINENGIMARPAWDLLHTLPMYKNAPKADLSTSQIIQDTLVNIPSSVNCNFTE